jgi:hypothetical protein
MKVMNVLGLILVVAVSVSGGAPTVEPAGQDPRGSRVQQSCEQLSVDDAVRLLDGTPSFEFLCSLLLERANKGRIDLLKPRPLAECNVGTVYENLRKLCSQDTSVLEAVVRRFAEWERQPLKTGSHPLSESYPGLTVVELGELRKERCRRAMLLISAMWRVSEKWRCSPWDEVKGRLLLRPSLDGTTFHNRGNYSNLLERYARLAKSSKRRSWEDIGPAPETPSARYPSSTSDQQGEGGQEGGQGGQAGERNHQTATIRQLTRSHQR